MSAYVIAQLQVHDPKTYRDYALQVGATLDTRGGRLLVASDSPDVCEGQPQYPRTVIGEFPTMAEARAWYDSAEYQSIAPLRQASAAGAVFIVEGLSLPTVPQSSE